MTITKTTQFPIEFDSQEELVLSHAVEFVDDLIETLKDNKCNTVFWEHWDDCGEINISTLEHISRILENLQYAAEVI